VLGVRATGSTDGAEELDSNYCLLSCS